MKTMSEMVVESGEKHHNKIRYGIEETGMNEIFHGLVGISSATLVKAVQWSPMTAEVAVSRSSNPIH